MRHRYRIWCLNERIITLFGGFGEEQGKHVVENANFGVLVDEVVVDVFGQFGALCVLQEVEAVGSFLME